MLIICKFFGEIIAGCTFRRQEVLERVRSLKARLRRAPPPFKLLADHHKLSSFLPRGLCTMPFLTWRPVTMH